MGVDFVKKYKMGNCSNKDYYLSPAGTLAIEYCRSFKGYSKEQIAREIGIDYETLMQWASENKQLAKTLEGNMHPIGKMLLDCVTHM